GQIVAVELEGRRDRGVQDLDLAAKDLDLTGGQLGVDRSFGAFAHQAGDAHAEFVADAFGNGKGFSIVGVDHDLGQARAVAKVDEDDATVVAAPVHPTE